ncbi:MAG: hypothetical protein K2N65_04835, partial [Anaeroplasmataceae bacterium]|nr:hypothetical protein [Anaeroplasmataceae bacterium]
MLVSFLALIITLSGCSSAGKPTGKLDKDTVYASAGQYKVTKGDLWNEFRWNASSILTDKITEVVMKDYVKKVEIVMSKSYTDLTDEEKKLFDENLTDENFTKLKDSYEDRLEDYVIEDIYNYNFDSENSYEKIADLNPYDAKKLVAKYCDEIFTNYNINKIEIEDESHNKKSIPLIDCVTEAANNTEHRKYYVTIAKELKTIYYQSLAKELLAYSVLEEDIKDAYDNRDTNDEDDLGYFSKADYTNKFKSKFANQSDLNLILIHFSTDKEFTSTLRAFGLKAYNNTFVFVPRGDRNFTDYCTYYDELTTSELRDLEGSSLNTLAIAQIYIQMYNYLYHGYRDMILPDSFTNKFDNVEDLITITEDIREKSQILTDSEQKEALDEIRNTLLSQENIYDVDTIYSRKEIEKISSSFSTYLYETLSLPYSEDTTSEDVCYSTSTQTYNSSYWIAFKFGLKEEEKYADIYN